MSAALIFDEIVDRCGEYLEMVDPDEQSGLLIQLLCEMVVKERDEKETYKKMFDNHKCEKIRLNS